VANGGMVDGVRLLSPETIDLIFHEQSNGVDLVLDLPLRFGIGYGLPNESAPYIDGGRSDSRACFWTGWGGSTVVVDTERRMTLAHIMNKMTQGPLCNPTSQALCTAAYGIVG
jgi:CubicO group peptidase (beta-lactamase class C family)